MLSENYFIYNLVGNNPLTLTLFHKWRGNCSLLAPFPQRRESSVLISYPLIGGDEGEGDKPKGQKASIYKPLLALCIVVSCVLLGGCGKKGPPIAPKETGVLQIKDIKGEALEGEIQLRWKMPKEREGSFVGLGIKEFKIYRMPGEKESATGRLESFETVGRLGVNKAQDLTKEMKYVDKKGLTEDKWYHYVVAGFGGEDRLYAVSDTVDVFFSIEPEPPKNLTGDIKENYVILQWDAPVNNIYGKPLKNLVGYNVYRKRQNEEAYIAINDALIKREKYVDMEMKRDEVYSYFVRAVDNFYPPWHESADSNIINIEYKDLTPPKAPEDLTVIGGIGRISLSWEKNKEPDLAGYRVYRSNISGKGYELLNKELIRVEFYDDISVERGKKYFYVITAVDNSKNANESSFSKEESGTAE